MPVTDIIRVSLDIETNANISGSNSIPAIVGQHTRFVDRWRSYTSLQGMLDEGFLTSDAEYAKAVVLLSQERRPASFVVGRRAAPVARVVVVTIATAVDATLYDFELDSSLLAAPVVVDFTSGVAATVTQIRDGLLADLTGNAALTGVLTAVATSTNQITITSAIPGTPFTLTESDPNITLAESVANVGVADDLAAIADEGALFYGVLLTSRVPGDILEAAAWVESSEIPRTLIAQSSQAASRDNPYSSVGTDLKSRLRVLGYSRTLFWVHHSDSQHMDAFTAGSLFPLRPGTETWALKSGAGVTPSPYTATQRANIRGGNANYYYEVSPGTSITWEGITSGGLWFDQLRLGDAISAGMAGRLFARMTGDIKVPMSDAGIQSLAGEVSAELESWEQAGALLSDPKYVVTAPLLEDISPANRSARILDPPIRAQANTSGAIHQVEVTGTLSP